MLRMCVTDRSQRLDDLEVSYHVDAGVQERLELSELPRAMRRLLLGYGRWFHRSRKREGSLLRGRCKARLIEDEVYRAAVARCKRASR